MLVVRGLKGTSKKVILLGDSCTLSLSQQKCLFFIIYDSHPNERGHRQIRVNPFYTKETLYAEHTCL